MTGKKMINNDQSTLFDSGLWLLTISIIATIDVMQMITPITDDAKPIKSFIVSCGFL